jgi:AcrR family transcriptional regulator
MAAQPQSVWTRTEKPRRDQPSLSRDQIVKAALELLDGEGLDGLSMRRLGTRLGAGATSLYWHVANKNELLELALDEVLPEVIVPDAREIGWRAAATAYAQSLRMMIFRHPWTVPLFGNGPMLGPNAVAHLDRVLALFEHAGFAGMDLEYAQAALVDYVVGSAGTEAVWQSSQTRAGVTAEDWMASLEPYLQRLSTTYPRLHAHLTATWTQDDDTVMGGRFAFALDALLDGLAMRIPPS